MDIVKKNLMSILCGVVALAALVALFWPRGSMYAALQADVNGSKAKYAEVEGLRKAPRKLPTLVLEGTGEQEMLTRFPNQQVIDFGKEKTKALTAQSKKMLETVTENNVHTPLVPGSLPRPNSRAASDFPQEYLTELGMTEQGYETGLPKLLRATRPPSNDELMEIAGKIWDEKYANRVFSIGGTDTYQQISDEFNNDVAMKLKEQEQVKRASEHLVYLDDNSLPASPEVQLGRVPTATQIWFAQSVLWIEQDVAKAINEANKGATNVLDAPVKHVVALSVPFGPEQYVRNAATVAGPPGAEAAPPPVDANGAPQAFAMSPTGRVCNDLYDVIHFDLVLRVNYQQVPRIMAELERNRLFTILSSGITSVDAAEEKRVGGYVYGDQPVAELTLRCEALFLRSWTVDKEDTPPYKDALMPDPVMQTVGAKPGPALPGTGGVPGEGAMPPGGEI